jgi:photoactive yellow protein
MLDTTSLPEFDEPELARAVERLSPREIDALDFGCIRIDAGGTVVSYSRRESELSGRGDRPVVGLQFFTAIAPCMNSPAFKGRIDAALASGTLDAEFMHVGDFSDRDRMLCVRAQSATGGGYWLFLKRD